MAVQGEIQQQPHVDPGTLQAQYPGIEKGGGSVGGMGGSGAAPGQGPTGPGNWGGMVPFNMGQIGGTLAEGMNPIAGTTSSAQLDAMARSNAINQANQQNQYLQAQTANQYIQSDAFRQQQMLNQQLQQQQLRTQTMQKLLGLFGGQGGGQQNPAQGFLQSLTGGQGYNLQNPLFQQLLQGRLGQVESAFNDPGGLRSKMQQMGTAQNRYSSDSTTGAARQNILDRNLGIARGQAFGGAFGDVIGPQLASAQTQTQGWLGGQLTPQVLLKSLAGMASGPGSINA